MTDIIEALAKSIRVVNVEGHALRVRLHWDDEGRPYVLQPDGTRAYLVGAEVDEDGDTFFRTATEGGTPAA